MSEGFEVYFSAKNGFLKYKLIPVCIVLLCIIFSSRDADSYCSQHSAPYKYCYTVRSGLL